MKNKGKNRKKFFKQPPPVAKLDMGFLNAAVVTPPNFKFVQIIVAGCGGIGAYLVQHVGRLMRVLYEGQKGVHLTLVDPDAVEEKNLGRQLFCDAELGVAKAEALARRYGNAWGLNVSTYVGKFDDSLLIGCDLTVVVGCVDNAEGRKSLHETLSNNPQVTAPGQHSQPVVWYLDCGNLEDTGTVMLGTAYEYEQLRGAFPGNGKCIALPSPGLQSPGLLVAEPEELDGAQMSCAELAMRNLQSLNINARVAAEAADILTRLLVTRDLKRFRVDVNLAAGSMRSRYATPEEVAQSIGKPEGFLKGETTGKGALVLEPEEMMQLLYAGAE